MLVQIATLLIDTLGSLFIYVLLLRFHMQWLRAPFRNPIGEFVTGLTNWIVIPARRFIPGMLGLDIATLLIAWLAQALVMALLMALHGGGFERMPGMAFVLLAALSAIELLTKSLNLLIGAAVLQALLSFAAPYSPVQPLLNVVTAPFYKPFRRFIPPIGSIDLSPLFLILAVSIVQLILGELTNRLLTLSLAS